MENGQCLMLKTKDKRKFYTHEENLDKLIEFSKMFKAEISIVSVREAEILDLTALAPAICDASFNQPQPAEVNVIEVKTCSKRCRSTIIENAKQIKKYIERKLRNGEVVSMQELMETYKGNRLTVACFCNYISELTKNLAKENIIVNRIGRGLYQAK